MNRETLERYAKRLALGLAALAVAATPSFAQTTIDLCATTGTVAMAAKLVDHPGEQLLVYRDDGTVSILADRNAEDSDTARKRYEHPTYRANRRLTSTGSNLIAVAGI